MEGATEMKIESTVEAIMIKTLTENFCKKCPHYPLSRNISNCDDCFVDQIENIADESYDYWKEVENESETI